MKQRWKIFFSGHVQGVGFRFQTRTVSQRFDVTGWVANLSNGDVQVIVEGDPAELQRFVDEIQTAMGGYIRRTEIEKGAATGEFSGFEIRHLG